MYKYIPIYKPIKGISPIEPIIKGGGIDGGTTLVEGWSLEGSGLI